MFGYDERSRTEGARNELSGYGRQASWDAHLRAAQKNAAGHPADAWGDPLPVAVPHWWERADTGEATTDEAFYEMSSTGIKVYESDSGVNPLPAGHVRNEKATPGRDNFGRAVVGNVATQTDRDDLLTAEQKLQKAERSAIANRASETAASVRAKLEQIYNLKKD